MTRHIAASTAMLSKLLFEKLNLSPSDPSAVLRVDGYYIPIHKHIAGLFDRRSIISHGCSTAESGAKAKALPPLFVGISAPQGSGKTTLTDSLQYLFQSEGKRCVVMSIDDFYLTGEDQDSLASEYSANPLLQYRGNAGSHDLPIMYTTMGSLSTINNSNEGEQQPKRQKVAENEEQQHQKEQHNQHEESIGLSTSSSRNVEELSSRSIDGVACIPRYDKAARNGRGDRGGFIEEKGPIDIVLFEGWMLGFSPLAEDSTAITEQCGMKDVNSILPRYRGLHDQMDTWIVLEVEEGDVSVVYDWRLEAEVKMRKALGGESVDGTGKDFGMSDSQVRDFVNRFMPAYRAYLPGLYALGPERRDWSGEPPNYLSGVKQLKDLVDEIDTDALDDKTTVLKVTISKQREPISAVFFR